MTTHRKITVAEWSESHASVVSKRNVHRQFLSPIVIGAAGSVLLHGLVLQTVVLASRAHKIRPPEIQEPESSLNNSAPQSADALVFIDLPKTAKTTNEIDEALAFVRAAIKDSPISIPHPEPPLPRDVETLALGEAKDWTSPGAEGARLYGIYTGQIQARIERAWRRPRTPVQEGSGSAKTSNTVEYFHCQAQIVQDSIGNVQEILLPNCNGSVAWQHSLVMAIQQSSPLPAPPSPTVFSPAITLEFIGYSYIEGGTDDEYEPTSTATLQATISSRH